MAKIWYVFKRSARRFEIALLVGLVLIGPIMGFSYYSLRQLDEARKVQEHSLVVREHLNDLRAAVRQYEILYLRDAPEESKGESRLEIDRILHDLSQSVEADEIQTESLAEVRAAIAEFVSEPTPEYSKEVREWILSMDAQEADFLAEHRPASITFLSTASGSILLVGILSLLLSILAFIGLRRQMRSREIIETELRVAERQATRASEMKSKFLATISHEIRTPLNGIIAMTEVIRGSSLPPKEKRLTDVIFQSSQALLRIINDLLNFSQIEAGQIGLEAEIFSIRSLVEQTCSVLDIKAQQKHLTLRRFIAEDVPENLEADGGRLGQVLFNLIGNGIKFTSNGYVDLKVERDPSSTSELARINFSVSDTGRGIPADELGLLFQPFHQSGTVGTSGEAGTGLGLSIAQGLVRQMGGEIRVESRENQGSVFWFQLPMKPGAVHVGESLATASTSALLPGPLALSLQGLEVLVTEDNATNQIVAQTVLEQLGCHVSLAATGLEAIEMLRTRKFDLILMDCQMPVMDGYEATRRIRDAELATGGARVPIVAMTANAQTDDRARCLAAGMDDYISKPFVTADLVRVISRHEDAVDVDSVGLGLEALEKRLGAPAVKRLREAFLASLREWPLASSAEAGDRDLLRELSHKLKSSAKTIGAFGFSERLDELEMILRNEQAIAATGGTAAPADISVLKERIDQDVENLQRRLT